MDSFFKTKGGYFLSVTAVLCAVMIFFITYVFYSLSDIKNKSAQPYVTIVNNNVAIKHKLLLLKSEILLFTQDRAPGSLQKLKFKARIYQSSILQDLMSEKTRDIHDTYGDLNTLEDIEDKVRRLFDMVERLGTNNVNANGDALIFLDNLYTEINVYLSFFVAQVQSSQADFINQKDNFYHAQYLYLGGILICSMLMIGIISWMYLNQIKLSGDLASRTRLMEEAKESAEQSAKTKARFLSNMSHEMRTPLNAIIGLSRKEYFEGADPQTVEFISMINSSGESLLKLINNVLDMSKMDQGKQQKESEAFFFNELIDRSKKLFAHFEKKQDVEVFFSVSCEKNYKIQSDKAKIAQIINNLGYNAFKFTHRGHVDIHLSLDRDSIMSHLVIKVKDTGIGMSSELLDKVFDEFTQADNSMSRPYRGTGLGLSICQSLTRVLGGTIRAHSVLDVGSEFVVDLPVEVVDEKALFPPDRKTPSVRVISEHRYAKQLIMTELMSVGVFDHEGDIVLYYASEMDSVKNDHPLEHNPSIIYGDVSLNKTAPNQAVRLSKPYDLFGLLNCLMTMTSADEGKPTPSATLPKIDRFSVLLVEDIHLNQVVARKMLTMFNAEVSAVNNGKECLDALEHQQFDIIFMDIQMPVMDGLEAIRFIKERNLAPGTPILALTANTFESDVQTYLDQGFDDVLPKPFKLEWMRELIVKYRVNT